jgi:hypothetical protein
VRFVVERLGRKQDKPLFLIAGLHKPHVDWDIPKNYCDEKAGPYEWTNLVSEPLVGEVKAQFTALLSKTEKPLNRDQGHGVAGERDWTTIAIQLILVAPYETLLDRPVARFLHDARLVPRLGCPPTEHRHPLH